MLRSAIVRATLGLGLCFGLVVVSGCAAVIPLVPYATAASAGARVASLGYATWSNGVLRSVEPVGFGNATVAVEATAERLALAIAVRHEQSDAIAAAPVGVTERSWKLASDRGHFAVVTVVWLTERMTRVTVSVGRFGDQASARLLLDQIRTELGRPPSATNG